MARIPCPSSRINLVREKSIWFFVITVGEPEDSPGFVFRLLAKVGITFIGTVGHREPESNHRALWQRQCRTCTRFEAVHRLDACGNPDKGFCCASAILWRGCSKAFEARYVFLRLVAHGAVGGDDGGAVLHNVGLVCADSTI